MPKAPTPAKPIWQSRTIWTSVVAVLALVGSYFGLDLDAEAQAALATAIGAVAGAVAVLLRALTTGPVKVKRE